MVNYLGGGPDSLRFFSGVSMRNSFSNYLWHRLVLILFVVYILFGLANIGEVWMSGHHGWNGARRSIQARNYLRFGYVETKLKPLDNLGYKDGEMPRRQQVYWHHPPLAMIYLSWVYALIGEGEIQARLGFLLLSCLTFLMMYGAMRRATTERQSFFILAFYTFSPVVATHINFVNFETVVLFAMASVLYGFEGWREERTVHWLGLILIGIAIGTLADFPWLPFSFFFFIMITYSVWIERNRPLDGFLSRLSLVFAYPIVQVLAVSSLLWLFLSWDLDWQDFDELIHGRSRSFGNSFHNIFVKKHRFYTGFFPPLALVASGIYIIIFIWRAISHKITRLDGYLFVYAGSAITLIFVISQWFSHNYAALYFAPCIAIASGIGFDALYSLISYKKWIEILTLSAFFCFLVTYSLPIIHSYNCISLFDYHDPIYGYKYRAKTFYSFYDYKTLASEMDRLFPQGRRLYSYGLKTNPWAKYYFDRKFDKIRNRGQLERLIKKGNEIPLVMDLNRSKGVFLKFIMKKINHIRIGRYCLFDFSRNRIRRTQVSVSRKTKQSDLIRYFTSYTRTYAKLLPNYWRSLDYALKLDRKGDVGYYRSTIQKGEDLKIDKVDLYRSITQYNLHISKGLQPELSELQQHLVIPKKALFMNDEIELLGYRIQRQNDGRQRITAVFKAHKRLVQHYHLQWRVKPRSLSEHTWYTKRLREFSDIAVFDVPTFFWKPDWIYYATFTVDIPFERYKIETRLKYVDAVSVQKKGIVSFKLKLQCKKLKKVAKDTLSKWKFERDMSLLPDDQDRIEVGKDFFIYGCAFARTGKKSNWHLALRVGTSEYNRIPFRWRIMKPRRVRAVAEMRYPKNIHPVKEGKRKTLLFNLRKEKADRWSYVRLQIAEEIGWDTEYQQIATQEVGIRFPFQFLVEADALRWIWRKGK